MPILTYTIRIRKVAHGVRNGGSFHILARAGTAIRIAFSPLGFTPERYSTVAASVEDDSGGTTPHGSVVRSWGQIRQRARSLLRSQCERMRQVEGQLTEQVTALLELVSAEHDQAQQRVKELREQVDALEQRSDPGDKRR